MSTSIKKLFVFGYLCVGITSQTFAGKLAVDKEDITWISGVDGVEVEMAADGSFQRLYSTHCQPVLIDDRVGLNKAYRIASAKARANIVRFISQSVKAKDVVTELQEDTATATREKSAAGDVLTTNVQRKMVESLNEVLELETAGVLKGVRQIESGYSRERAEACVRVGVTKESLLQASSINDATTGAKPGQRSPTSQSGAVGSDRVGSEYRRVDR